MNVWQSERGRQAQLSLLRHAAVGDDPALAELAREVLAGRMEPRDVLYSEAYGEVMRERMRPMLAMWEGLSEAELQHAVTHADDLVEQAVDGIEQIGDPPPPDPPRPAPRRPLPEEDETFEYDTFMRKHW